MPDSQGFAASRTLTPQLPADFDVLTDAQRIDGLAFLPLEAPRGEPETSNDRNNLVNPADLV